MEIIVATTIIVLLSAMVAFGESLLLRQAGAGTARSEFIPERWTSSEQGTPPSIYEHADDTFQQLQQILAILNRHPNVEVLLTQALRRRSMIAHWRQFLTVCLGNMLSIVVGWFLSGLISPIVVLKYLHF